MSRCTPSLWPAVLLVTACGAPSGEGGPQSSPVEPSGPTWYGDVQPIVAARCEGCHTEGGISFSLHDYDAAKAISSAMAAATGERRMPPWSAQETEDCQPRLPWKDDQRLTDEQIATIEAWSKAGAPEGERPTDGEGAPAAALESLDAPSVTLTPEAPYSTSGDADEFLCFSMDLGLDAPRYVDGVEIVPGNRSVVHHALVFIDYDGKSADLADEDGKYDCFGGAGVNNVGLLAAWAPGSVPLRTPEGSGTELPAGARLIMQVHYHPRGQQADPDLTEVRLSWSEEEPALTSMLFLIGNSDSVRNGLLPDAEDPTDKEFRIPAGEANHVEEMVYTLPRGTGNVKVWLAGTHMHYIGKDMYFGVERTNPDEGEPTDECLIQTPDWDFNWQRGYVYDGTLDELPELNATDTLVMRCTYDNTLDHPGTVAALEDGGLTSPIDVYLGEETLDEMCLGVAGIVY